MKNLIIISIIFCFVWCSCQQAPPPPPPPASPVVATTEAKRVLRHMVMFKFKDDAPEEKVREIETAFANLPSKIPEIASFEWGLNNSPEGLNKGLTHCFLVTFNSEKDREIYLPHPDHKAFVELLGPHLEDVTVVDFWSK